MLGKDEGSSQHAAAAVREAGGTGRMNSTEVVY